VSKGKCRKDKENGSQEEDWNQEKRDQERLDGLEEDFHLERGMGDQTN